MLKRSTIGTDPEFFVKRTDGKFLNAETMFPGTKDAPFPMNSGAGLQTDNVAVEFASPVGENGEDLVAKLRNTFNELFLMLPANTVLDLSPAVLFDHDQLQTEQAQLFGCSPSYCAWDLVENERPNATLSNLRSAGAHIHIGKADGDGNDFLLDPYGKINTVRMCDCLHGIISVVLDNSKESVMRRELYGKAGEHRPKDYGVEYRTLSPFWMKSPNLVMLIDALTQDALRLVREEKHEEVIAAIGGGDVVRAIINNGQVDKARSIIEDVLFGYMSDDSKYFFKECSNASSSYKFEKEWQLTV